MPVLEKQRHIPARLAGRLATLTTVVLLSLAGTALYFWTWRPDPRLYPVLGIDVSHHQGRIDWQAVARSGLDFAYLKASEGGDYTDPSFALNRIAARQAGLKVGAYHFFTLCRSGREQARHFLAVLLSNQTGDGIRLTLPPAVDLEFGGNCQARPSPSALQAELADFLALVEPAFGQPVLLYTTDEFDMAYGAVLPPRPRWRRSLFHMPASADWRLWQFHNAAHIVGINGRVDLNAFNGGPADSK